MHFGRFQCGDFSITANTWCGDILAPALQEVSETHTKKGRHTRYDCQQPRTMFAEEVWGVVTTALHTLNRTDNFAHSFYIVC